MKGVIIGILALALVILPLAGCGDEVVKEVKHEAPVQEYTLVVEKCPKTASPYVAVSLSQLARFLPEPPPGWTIYPGFLSVGDPELTVFREYAKPIPGKEGFYSRTYKLLASVDIVITDFGPILSPGHFMGPHLDEPIISIEGYPATEDNGDLSIYICGRFIVDISGSREYVYMFVDRIDFHGIAALGKGMPGDTIEELPGDNGIPGDTIELNELITTDEHTRKKIIIPDVGEVILNVNSEVKFESPTTFSIIKGELRARVKKLGPRYFEVWMPQAIAGVRGTEFLISVEEDGTTTLTVLEGTVEFSDLNEKKTVVVGKNQRSVVEPGGLPAEPISIDVKLIPIWWE